jgi:hypothetical protein
VTDEPVTATWVFADGSRSSALIVECLVRGETQVRILWNVYLDMYAVGITSRIDEEPPITQDWPVDANGTSSFYPTDDLAFLSQMFDRTRLVAQVQPWNQDQVTLTFPIAGIESAVTNVRTACGW